MAGVALVALWSDTAHACSPIRCSPAAVFPARGDVPQNQLRFRLQPLFELSGDAGVTTPRLYAVEGGRRREIALTVTTLDDGALSLVPKSIPAVGTNLVLEADRSACGTDPSLRAEFVVTAAVIIPLTLGSLQVELGRGELAVPTTRGSCTVRLDAAYADLTLLRAPTAQPLADVTEPHLWVDGVDFHDATRVYATCQPFNDPWANQVNLKLGTHRAELRGQLPDGSILTTGEINFELHCAVADAGASASDAGGPTSDASVALDANILRGVDASKPKFDGAAPDAPAENEAVDRGPVDVVVEYETADRPGEEGCVLVSPRRGIGTVAGWVTFAIASLWLRRRRMQSTAQS